MRISDWSSDVCSSDLSEHPLLIDGRWVAGEGERLTVLDKYHLTPFATVTSASPRQVTQMVEAAHGAYRGGAPLPYERGAILDRAAALVVERQADFVRTMQAEAGFTEADAGGEVRRCIQTLRLSGEEARRLAGDVIPLEGAPQQEGRLAFTLRVPLGVVVAITPFNSPLNTVAHKIAPAFAAGNAVILKPSSNTPATACKLAQALLDAGMPAGFLSVAHGRGAALQACWRIRGCASSPLPAAPRSGAGYSRRQACGGPRWNWAPSPSPFFATMPTWTARCRRWSMPATARPARSAPRSRSCRSEERRVGKEWVRTCRSRWAPDH